MIFKNKISAVSNIKDARDALRYSVQPLVRWAQLFDAAPFPIKAFSNNSAHCMRNLKLGMICQAIWAGTLIAATSVSLVYKRRWRLDGLNVPFFTYVLYNMEIILGLLNCTIVHICCQWKRPRYDNVLNQMVSILNEFGKFGEEQDLVWLRYQFSKYLLVGGFYFVVIVAVDATYYWKVIVSVCTTGAYFVPNAVQFLSLLQYAYVVIFAYRKCRAVNAILLAVRYSLRSNFKSYCSTIRTLRKQHMLLHRLVFQVNRDFGVLIILAVFSVLVAISITCLEMYQYTHEKTLNFSTIHYVIYSALWVLMYVCKLLIVLIPNHLMVNERDLTGMILQGLPLVESKEFTNETLKFSRQVLLQKGPYTANGVFVLDLTLLVHIFGALATYLVILIQFDQSPRIKN
uniref:gustatory receptor 35 n=1 Tax=Aedes aegypti TaxID=7159 RepID=UPI000C1CC2E0|nr:gustatory receptor 35 [Aedes aegypti]